MRIIQPSGSLITEKEMDIINDKRSKEKQAK